MTGLAPVGDAEWPPSIATLKDGFAGRLNVYRVLAHHPELLSAWAPLREQVVRRNSLPARLQELIVLRTAYHAASAYERAHHELRGREAGLAPDEIAATARTDASSALSGADALVVGAVDELHRSHRLASTTLESLAGVLDARQVLDLMALVGFYHVLAYVANTYAPPIDAAAAP
jgi:4-carboxymuconolactone decarboxylase